MASREPSAAPSSSGDTVDDQVNDSTLAPPEVDDTASDFPARTATPNSTRGVKRARSGPKKPRSKKGEIVWSKHQGLPDGTEDESTPAKIKHSDSADPDTKGTAVGTRRQANGTVGSVYSGSKIRHIKKQDGVPLWRKEIQYAFLNEVVHDETRCFTRLSDGQRDCTFAEIYIDSMARSSKTSKILKDRLQVDKPAAQNMAMICLLVNVGRMNTTLNFFPEMRAQLRTYHPIPALQAYPTQRDYKSLQDAPRLKSILKGASEDEEQPKSLPQLRTTMVPRSNPVNLIFVLSQAANEISQLHFLDKIDFFDLAIRPTVSSHSRAVAFLWLMWWYLESDFSKEAALNNPFGSGEYKEGQDPEDPEEVPMLVPKLEHITEEEGDAENVDTEIEVEFGEKMTKERLRINAKFAEEDALTEQAGASKEGGIEHKGVKRLKRSARELDDIDSSDVDSRASPGASVRMRSPAVVDTPGQPPAAGLQADSLEDDWEVMDSHPGRGRYKRARGKNTPSRSKGRGSEIGLGSVSRTTGKSRLNTHFSDRGTPDTLPGRGTPQPHPLPPGGINHPILSQFPASRTSFIDSTNLSSTGAPAINPKSRARTGYQRELEHHKQRRVDWLVSKKRREALKEQREKRERQPCSWLLRAAKRIESLDVTYDSDEDDSAVFGVAMLGIHQHGTGLGGVISSKKASHYPLPAEKTSELESAKKEKDNAISADATDTNVQLDSDANALVEDLDEDPLAEESEHWKRIFQRASRRLFTWSGDKDYNVYLHTLNARANPTANSSSAYPNVSASKIRPLSRGEDVHGAMPASSIANSTPRKHESRKSLDDEITQDLLAERSADEGEEEDEEMEEDVDADGDTLMGERPLGRVMA